MEHPAFEGFGRQMDDLRFSYAAAPGRMVLAIVTCLALSAVAAWYAINDDSGLLINRVIELDPAAARIFILACAAVLTALALAALYALIAHRHRGSEVVLTPDALEAPKSGYSTRIRRVPYNRITGVEVLAVQRHRFLRVTVAGDRKLTIAAAQVDRGQGFDRLVAELDARVRAVQPRPT